MQGRVGEMGMSGAIGEGSEAPLYFLLFPVGGAAAILREGGVPVGQRERTQGVGEAGAWETSQAASTKRQMQGGEPGQGPAKGRFQESRIIFPLRHGEERGGREELWFCHRVTGK